MARENGGIYEFGPFRLDVAEHRFERIDGRENGSLSEKAFQTLVLLVSNRGRLVSKDELLGAVWPDTIVEENNLDKAIHAIRHALGEKPGEHRYVETVRKHGYRFVADVTEVDRTVPGTDGGSGAVGTSKGPLVRTVSVLVLVLLAVAALLYRFGSSDPPARKLFVLPIQPVASVEQRDELLELGIADAIINRLSAVDGLIVRSLHATRDHAAFPQDPVAAGKKQQTDYVLASNFQRADGKIRVTSQLINVAGGNVEGSYVSEVDFRSVFGVQDTVSSEIAARILRDLHLPQAVSGNERGTRNEQAYLSYLEGMFHYDTRNREGAEKAIQALTRAVELDANYARAWAGKAHAHLSQVGFGRDSDSHGQSALAKDAIDRAISLNDKIADTHSALCLANGRLRIRPCLRRTALQKGDRT